MTEQIRVHHRNDGSDRPWTFECRTEDRHTKQDFATLREALGAWTEFNREQRGEA